MGSRAKREKEYKNLPLEIKEFDEEAGVFSGYLSTFGNTDKGDDVICKGAFTKTIAESKAWASEHKKDVILPILFMHDRNYPLGGFTDLSEDEHGLFVKGFLDISTNDHGIPNNVEATKSYSGMKRRYTDELSVGFFTIKKDYKDGIRYLREIALFEGSVVVSNMAMNPQALITSVKSEQEEATPMSIIDLSTYYRVARATRGHTPGTASQKDFNATYASAQAMDCLMDWYDLSSSLQSAMMDVIMESEDPQTDAMTSLDQFKVAALTWTKSAQDLGLSAYLKEQQSSMGYMSLQLPTEVKQAQESGESKAGMTFSKKNRDTIDSAVKGIQGHASSLQDLLDAFDVANNDKDTDKSTPEPESSTQGIEQPDTSTATPEQQQSEVKQEDIEQLEREQDLLLAQLLAETKALFGLNTGA